MATLLDYRRASIPMPIGQPPRCNARRHIVLTKSPITMPGNTSSSSISSPSRINMNSPVTPNKVNTTTATKTMSSSPTVEKAACSL